MRVDGVSVRDRPAAELRRGIGYAIQQIGLFPHLTVAENIGTVPKLLGWDGKKIGARVTELLDLVGLEQPMGKRYPAQLSGGQRQRVGVARALAADPPLLLMDEPFGAIDPITRGRLQEEFRRLQTDLGKTVIFVTHDIDEALRLGDHIAVLKPGGVLAQFGTAEELVRQPGRRVRRGVRRRRPHDQAPGVADLGPRGGALPVTAGAVTFLAQVKLHEREPGKLSCVQDNGVCPDWIVHHFDDYLSPLWRHLELTLSSVAHRLRDRVRRSRCWPTSGAG